MAGANMRTGEWQVSRYRNVYKQLCYSHTNIFKEVHRPDPAVQIYRGVEVPYCSVANIPSGRVRDPGFLACNDNSVLAQHNTTETRRGAALHDLAAWGAGRSRLLRFFSYSDSGHSAIPARASLVMSVPAAFVPPRHRAIRHCRYPDRSVKKQTRG